MNNEKILKIILALLSVFVIAAGVYIIIGQPGNEILVEEKKWEKPERQKPVTSARDENEEIDLAEISPTYKRIQESDASTAAWIIYYNAENFSEDCYTQYVHIKAAPYKGEIKEVREEKPEIRYGTDYTEAGIAQLLSQYLESCINDYNQPEYGAYIVAFGEDESPISVYFAESFESGYIGTDGEYLIDTEKFTTLNAIYDELLRMYEEEPETFDNREDYDSFYDDFGNTDDTENTNGGGEVLNIYDINYALNYDIEHFYLDHLSLPEGVEIKLTSTSSGRYEDELTDGLFGNAIMADDYKVDLFILEPSMAADILNSDYVMSLSELGFTEEELADQFPYTVSLTSDDNGVQKGLMYKLYPEVFIYRKSIAKQVLGTDDPAEVSEYVKDRESFEATAEEMKRYGIKMLGSYEEDYTALTQPFNETVSYEDGELVIPKSWEDWAKLEKTYIDKGYVLKTPRFYTDEWKDGVFKSDSFGFIGSESFMYDFILYHSEYTRDFAICPAPAAAYSEDITDTSYIICVAKGTDNKDLAVDIMRKLALDKENLKYIAIESEVLTNTVSGMNELASEKTKAVIFDDINPFGVYAEVAGNIANVTPKNAMNNEIFEIYRDNMEDYFKGEKTYEQCYEQFLEDALE
jgi:ABC-type glycerol-3-phosphate transport system substrate-binding protein